MACRRPHPGRLAAKAGGARLSARCGSFGRAQGVCARCGAPTTRLRHGTPALGRPHLGPDVSKTEEIRASVAWVSPMSPAMTWCFRCIFGVLSASHRMVPGLISSVLDTRRARCAMLTPEHSCPRSEAGCRSGNREAGVPMGPPPQRDRPGRGHPRALGPRRGRGFAPPTRVRGRSRGPGLVIREEASVKGSSPR